jgi:hypothetical protein
LVVPMTFCGSGGRICWRWVAWKAAILVDLGAAVRAKAGRSCWANGDICLMEELLKVENMRWVVAGLAMLCLSKPGRMREAIIAAIAGQRKGRGSWSWWCGTRFDVLTLNDGRGREMPAHSQSPSLNDNRARSGMLRFLPRPIQICPTLATSTAPYTSSTPSPAAPPSLRLSLAELEQWLPGGLH